jgi:multidrug resistance efflux pump
VLTEVRIRPDQRVLRGQVLGRLDTAALDRERQLLQQEIASLSRQQRQSLEEQQALQEQELAARRMLLARLESVRRDGDKAAVTQEFQRRELERFRTLQNEGAVARSLVEEQEARLRIGGSDLAKVRQTLDEQQARGAEDLAALRRSALQARVAAEELEKGLGERRHRLQMLERDRQDSVLRAPAAGTVLGTVIRHRGQVIRPGEVVATIAPAGALHEIVLKVTSRQRPRLRPGQPAMVTINGCSRSEFGVLRARVDSVADDVVSRGLYEVRLRPSRQGLSSTRGRCPLRPGLEVDADVTTRMTTVLRFLADRFERPL